MRAYLALTSHNPSFMEPIRDRDAKQRWAATVVSSGWSMGMGGFGGQILTGVVKKGVGRVFG